MGINLKEQEIMSKIRTNNLDRYVWYSRKLVVCFVTEFFRARVLCVAYQNDSTETKDEFAVRKLYRAQKQNGSSQSHNY